MADSTISGLSAVGTLDGTEELAAVQSSTTKKITLSEVKTFVNRLPVLLEYTVSSLPTASSFTAGVAMVTDETGGYTMAFSDGTNWRRVQDRAIVS